MREEESVFLLLEEKLTLWREISWFTAVWVTHSRWKKT